MMPNPWVILAVVLALLGAAAGGYMKGRHDEKTVAVERERNALIAYAERITEGDAIHDKDQLTINRLAADIKRLRIHIPVCGPVKGDQNGSAGALSNRVDAAFERLQEGVGALVQRCDQLNIDTIRANQ